MKTPSEGEKHLASMLANLAMSLVSSAVADEVKERIRLVTEQVGYCYLHGKTAHRTQAIGNNLDWLESQDLSAASLPEQELLRNIISANREAWKGF